MERIPFYAKSNLNVAISETGVYAVAPVKAEVFVTVSLMWSPSAFTADSVIPAKFVQSVVGELASTAPPTPHAVPVSFETVMEVIFSRDLGVTIVKYIVLL